MSLVIWHNPRCSKSRATLKLLEDNGIAVEVRLYLEDPPSQAELRDALSALELPASALVRKGEAEWKASGLGSDSSEAELVTAMARFPKLIERPVVFSGSKARIGRPPESVLEILDRS